jgi:hypothetical protein
MAPPPPEPCRDQKTISSFKRTFNSAILTLVARDLNRPARKYAVTILVGLLGWHFRSDLTAFVS